MTGYVLIFKPSSNIIPRMKKYLYYLFIITIVLTSSVASYNAYAGTVKCPDAFVILTGTSSVAPGYTYTEHLEMHKIGKSPGYNGKWKVDRFVQTNTYPHAINPPITTDEVVDFKNGMHMRCKAFAGGNRVVSTCTGGNLTLDVVNNRIGSSKTGVWIGKIQGKAVSLKFHKENPMEPVIKGTLQEVPGGNLKLNISTPTSGQRYVYSSGSPGKISMNIKANVTPADKANDIKWTLPEIAGSTRTVTPATAKGESIDIEFEKLPSQNSSFGKKKIVAELDMGACKVTDEKEIEVYYPRDAKNNPDGSVPNWFYYWSQTSAKKGPAKFGGLTGKCASSTNGRDGLIGYYRYIHRDPNYYICDLSRLPGNFEFTAVAKDPTAPSGIGDVRTKGIDTFAVSSRHENEHYEHFKKWWFQFNPNPIRASGGHMKPGYDKDGDFIPNTEEPALNLDPNDKYTLRQLNSSIDIDDEEWLAWLAETTWAVGSADKEDWAKPGKQWP